jgi:23S rRNA pseudouridine1911/1915/1917 synthase
LLFFDETLRLLPRAGIVHRLDKDTSGLMVVARSEHARRDLIEQLKDHSVSRRYLALVTGLPVTGETINQPIGRHRFDRLRMTVTDRGKPAITHTRIKRKYRCHTLLEAHLETGRTHQIRVHLSWRGLPLVGDSTYGARLKLPAGADQKLVEALQSFKRQALHATGLSLKHPRSGENMDWMRQPPLDMSQLLDALERDLVAD